MADIGYTHQEQHLKSSDLITDIVIGMSDGLTVPFALAAGLSGAVANSSLVVTAGIAEIVAGSIAMGLGGYLAGRTEVDHNEAERRREMREVDEVPDIEKEEVRVVFATMGLSPALQTAITDELTKDKTKWPGRPLGLYAGNIPRIGKLPVVNQRGIHYRAAEDSDLCTDLGPSLFSPLWLG